MDALPKASATTWTPASDTAPKKRSASEAWLDEDEGLLQQFICPISYELPVDPVLAADGLTYNREHILDWFGRHAGDTCPSPMTNKPIPKTLVSATQIKSTISLLVNRGIIANKRTEEWKRAVKEQEGWTGEFKSAMYEASGGSNATKMLLVGDCYRDGVGTGMNREMAVKWYTKASLLGNVRAAVALGVMYTNGVEASDQRAKQRTRGVLELARAATLGSEHACCLLADWLGGNISLFRVDTAAATFWYKASLSCPDKDSVPNTREKRDTWFKEHVE